ncbi:MAG: Rrf2 family transcriptional regulator [Candidatus Omnitrophica bacterium]|nr:Rrf2 family transcriptional regulator [Candidatus Omnitrophota bacterium]
MKLVTRNTDYAVRALCYMAHNKKRVVSVGELVSKLKIPRPFLRKILQALHKNNILVSMKGQGGGFELASETDKISILKLIGIFQGPFKLNECIFKGLRCPNIIKCRLNKKIEKIERQVRADLKSINLADLLG